MKIIFDNIVFELQKAGGISVYWWEMLLRLYRKSDSGFLSYNGSKNNIFFKNFNGKFLRETSSIALSIRRYFPFLRMIEQDSIFHSSYYRVSLSKHAANVTTVHDFTYEIYEHGVRRMLHSLQKKFAITHSDGIICVSENTKLDLIKHYPELDKSKIKVIYNGVGNDFCALISAQQQLENHFPGVNFRQFIVFVGDRSPYKNFDKAVGVLKNFPELQFVVVGGKPFEEGEREQLKGLGNRVFHFRGISSESLNIIYNAAFCLLYPSDYEGFGIPILEAMKAGCPVVSSNKSSIPEVAGDAALLASDTHVEEFVTEIKKIYDSDMRASLIEKGFTQASKFSWEKCFQETYAFYQEVYNRKFGQRN